MTDLSWGLPAIDTFEDLAAQAATARDANDIPKAIALYGKALDIKPDWIEGLWFLGTLNYDSDQYAGCRDALTRLVKVLDPPAAPPLTMLGLCEYSAGDYAKSLDHLQGGLKLASGKLEPSIEGVARFHEALLLTKNRQFDMALQRLVPFARGHSADSAVKTGIGLAALRRALVPEEIRPQELAVVTATGQATYDWMAGDTEKASAELKALTETYPRVPYVHYLYGSFLVDKDSDAGTAEFRQELQISPSNASAQAMLTLQLYRADNLDEAWRYATKAAQSEVLIPKAELALGLLLAKKGETEKSVSHLKNACDLEPNDFECHVALASVYSKLGQAEDSRRERFAAMQLAQESAPNADQ